MYIGPSRPLSDLEDLELRRDRLNELIALGLVSPTLSDQIQKAVATLEGQITEIKRERKKFAA